MRHLVIPDTQVTPDSNTDHLVWAAKYAAEKKPGKIIFLADHWDMESLCSYDEGKMCFEGRQYTRDIEAGINAMRRFVDIIEAERERCLRLHLTRWNYELHFTLGNHENRINLAVEKDRKLEGLISVDDFKLEEMGFIVHPFLQPAIIDGIAYAHYFQSGIMGRPVSSARAMINKKHMSCIMGHVPDRDIVYARKADGTTITGLFAGIFYQEDLDYLSPQTNRSWRGIWLFNDVVDGSFDELPISMKYLQRKYG